MASRIYSPLDTTPYPQDPNSFLADQSVADGNFVYAQNIDGMIYFAPDGPHQHPKILGGGQSVRYAGDVRIYHGMVTDVTNLSGTFCCDEPDGLLAVAKQLARLGIRLQANSIRFFPADGSKPLILG
jgi:hypothetical protein